MALDNPSPLDAQILAELETQTPIQSATLVELQTQNLVNYHTAVPDGLFRSYLDTEYAVTSLYDLSIKTGGTSLVGKGIQSAKGLEYATNTNNVYLSGNDITTFPDISALTSIINLEIRDNNIPGVVNISRMTAMTNLTATNNLITSVGDVSLLTSLGSFRINQNEFTQESLEDTIDQLWDNRVALGANSCIIQLALNPGSAAAAASRASEIADIESEGSLVTI